jgi:hypothetical protein
MKKQIEPGIFISSLVTIKMFLLAAFAAIAFLQIDAFAADEFQDLVNQIPRSANAVVLLNMEKAKNSPLGIKENWKSKIEKAFEAGLFRVPPQATRFVLASEIDFEFKEPLWEVAIIDVNENFSMEKIAEKRQGTTDTIENLPAIALPNDTYLVQLGPKTLGAMAPANRQTVVRWIREIRKPSPQPLSPYLQKAAVFSDKTGSEIIMAIDLDGMMSFKRVGKYLKSKQKELDEWGANLIDVTNLLSEIQGMRIGVRIGDPSSAMVAVDLRGDATPIKSFAKPLFLQILSDLGASSDNLNSWTAQAKKNEISLAGKLDRSGLRRLLSVVDAPAIDDDAVANSSEVSPGELPAVQAKAAREHFRAVTEMFDDLKDDMKSSRNLASTQLWFDKYAKRIERLPVLNVDPELLDYSAFVASQLRKASLASKTMGIQSGVRQAQITTADVAPYAVGTSRWGRYGYYGGYGGARGYAVYDRGAEMKAVESERRVVRAEEKAVAATDIQQLRQDIIAATTDMRRKMTQKYKVEF